MKPVIYKNNREETLDKVLKADFIISDFDGTDVKSPLKIAAIEYCSKLDNLLKHPGLIAWGFKAITERYLTKGKDAESALWEEFSERVGDDIHDMINSLRDCFWLKNNAFVKKIDSYFLPGVKQFYATLPETENFYVSRNFTDILALFGSELNIPLENIYSELPSKGLALEQIVEKNKLEGKKGGIYLLRGDSKSDDEVLDVAEHYRRKQVIDDYVGIAIGNSSHSSNDHVDVVLSPNQCSFVEELNLYRSKQ